MRKNAAVVTSIVFGLILGMLTLVDQCQAAVIGHVIALNPGVSVERNGNTLPLALKDPIELHDVVQSNATGKVQIIFSDDTTLSAGPNSRLNMQEFADSGDQSRFNVHLGQGLARLITGKIVEQNPQGFSVTTPEAVVGIRGTILTVRSDQGSTTVFVENTLHREVFVNNTQIPQGFKAVVNSLGAVPTPQPISPQEQQTIEQESQVTNAHSNENLLTALAPTSQGANTTLDDTNLNQQKLGESLTKEPLPPTTAVVSGSLREWGVAGETRGTFSFDVALGSGSISNASMSGSKPTAGLSNLDISAFTLHGGSGSIGNAASGMTEINGFTASRLVDGNSAVIPNASLTFAQMQFTAADSRVIASGSGSLSAASLFWVTAGGAGVSGNVSSGTVSPQP